MRKRDWLWLAAVFCGTAQAELFTFDLANRDGAVWENVSAGVYTNAGSTLTLEATLAAYLDGTESPGSLLNSTGSSFGINAAGAGDDSAFFDTNNGQEALWVSFDRDVMIRSFTVGSFTAGNVETGAYQVAESGPVPFTASGTYTVDAALTAGSFFKVIAVDEGGGNGWSLSSFTVEAVPEPATIAMLGLGALAMALLRRMSRA